MIFTIISKWNSMLSSNIHYILYTEANIQINLLLLCIRICFKENSSTSSLIIIVFYFNTFNEYFICFSNKVSLFFSW